VTDSNVRIGLIIEKSRLPRWACGLIRHILEADGLEVAISVVAPLSDGKQSFALYRAWQRVDQSYFARPADSLQPESVAELLSGVFSLKASQDLENSADAIRKADLDVLLDLRDESSVPLVPLAKHGVWSLFVGASRPSGFTELAEARPTTESGLLQHLPDGQVHELYRSSAWTHPSSIRRNVAPIWTKTALFALRKLEELRKTGSVSGSPSAVPVTRFPSNRQTATAALRVGSRLLIRQVRSRLFFQQWQLAMNSDQGPFEPCDPRVIAPPRDRFWADPFGIERDGDTYVFFEELVYATGRGRIVASKLSETGTLSPPVVVLECDYHLSYPFLFEWKGELFMLPETSENRTIEVYRCVGFPDRWEKHCVLMNDLIAVDATLNEIDGRWWMFVNIAAPGASTWDELHIFHAPEPFGPWLAHAANPVKSDVRSARPAGALFKHDDHWIRPAQDCSVRYGHALTFQRIELLDTERFSEAEVARIEPDAFGARALGTHTHNNAGRFVLFDRLASVPRWTP